MCVYVAVCDKAEPPDTLFLLPQRLTTENWNNLVSTASGLLSGWQSTLVGQSGLLQGDKEIYGETEMKRECEIVQEFL